MQQTISKLQNISTNTKQSLLNTHPSQWLNNEIKFPIWKIKYSYITNRGNKKEHIKYLIADEQSWDLIDPMFDRWLDDFNDKHPERMLSNVEILDTEFMDEYLLPLE
jgi:hypothetical protein